MACDKCGQEHVTSRGRSACTGHKRFAGPGVPLPDGPRPCRRDPMHGQQVCASHGGRAPQAKAAAERRVTEQRAERIMRRFGGPIDTTPTEALLGSVKWVAGYVAFLRGQVERVTEDAETADHLIWGKTKTVEKDVAVAGVGLERGEDTVEEAKPNAWLVLLGDWQDRLTRLCAEAIKAGIEERRVRLAEQQGQLVADVIKAILGDLGLSPEQAARVPEIVPRHLRLLTGGAA